MAIIRSRDHMEGGIVSPALLASVIQEHQAQIPRLRLLDDYYHGRHEILRRQRREKELPNNKLVVNHARYITNLSVGYFGGHPIKYAGSQIELITDLYQRIDITSHDSEMITDISIYGYALELYYMDATSTPRVTCLDPQELFLVVDDTVEYKSLFGVHYYPRRDLDGQISGYVLNVYTDKEIVSCSAESLTAEPVMGERKAHYFGSVPVVEIWGNEECVGDFEPVLSLIDAYNVLQSDRINDKQQFVDSILLLKGFSLGDDPEEAARTIKLMRELATLEMPDKDSSAGWLTKQLNEAEVEVLRDAVKSDIHSISMVPDLTDENFASNASGVAMKYKLFGLEQLAATKERYYIQGLRERLAMFAQALALKSRRVVIDDVKITMTRNIPADDLQTSQVIASLTDHVSNETLISELSFVDNAKKEMKRLATEQRKKAKQLANAYGDDRYGDEDDE